MLSHSQLAQSASLPPWCDARQRVLSETASNRRVQHQRIVGSLTPMLSVMWSGCRSVSCQQPDHPSRCHSGARLFCGEEMRHSTAWGGDALASGCAYSSFLGDRQTTLLCRPAEICPASKTSCYTAHACSILFSGILLTPDSDCAVLPSGVPRSRALGCVASHVHEVMLF